jgi:hypothetical protein
MTQFSGFFGTDGARPKFVHGVLGRRPWAWKKHSSCCIILLYLQVDDAYRMVTLGGRLRQRGPEPKLSDVEVLTMEIFGEQQGRHDDAAIHRYFDGHWRHFFPELGSYQAFARQCAALSVIKQRILNLVFPASDTIHLLDGFPIPVCRACRGHRCRTFRGAAAWGYCATKKEHFYGLRWSSIWRARRWPSQ